MNMKAQMLPSVVLDLIKTLENLSERDRERTVRAAFILLEGQAPSWFLRPNTRDEPLPLDDDDEPLPPGIEVRRL
jgi:hypothetical protein